MRKLNKIKIDKRQLFDAITLIGIIVGIIALLALIYYQVRPIQLAEIKVPVATDKATYKPSDQISGIFFGSTHYSGEVRILREVFCKNYRGVIIPPDESRVDGNFFSTQAKPRKLEGVTIMIGKLPDNVPIGSNCVIQFTNIYLIKTPFGDRRDQVQYYTQNFSIISAKERDERDSEQQQQQETQQQELQSSATDGASSFEGGGTQSQTNTPNNQNTQPPPVQEPPSEPVTPPEECVLDLLGIKLICS